jgi:hypothetical protein
MEKNSNYIANCNSGDNNDDDDDGGNASGINHNNNNKCDWIEGEEEIEEPGVNDIILGRGGGASNHPGNVNFRKLVNRYKIQYLACSKNDKPRVAKLVVKMWRNQWPPGRFLRRVDKALTTTTGSNNIDIDTDTATPKYRSYVWREVTEKRSQAKASQCLRERTAGVLPYLQRMEVHREHILTNGDSIGATHQLSSCGGGGGGDGDIMGNVMMGTSTSASSTAASNHQRHNNNNNYNNNNHIMPSTMMGMYAHQRPNMATTSLGGNNMNNNSPMPTSLNYLQAQAQMHMAMKRRAIQNAYILNTTKAQSGNNIMHTYPHAQTIMSTRQQQQQQQQEMMRKQAMMMKMMMIKKRQAARMMMYKQYQQPRASNNNNNNNNVMMASAVCGATAMMQASNSLGIDQYGENMMNQQQHIMKQQQQQQQLAMDAHENDLFVHIHAVTNPNNDIHTRQHNIFKQTMEDKSEMNDENYTNSSKNLDDDNDGIDDGIDDDDEGHVDNDNDNDEGHCDEGQPIPLSVIPDDSQQSPATGN